jgi:hypothetical protein
MMKVYSTKRAIIDLMIVKEQVIRVFNENENYKNFIEFIFSKDYLNDNNLRIPTIKQISIEIGSTSSKVTKLIKELYNEFFENKLIFNKTEITFYIKRFDNYLFLKCNNLKYIPKVGEEICIPFIKTKTSCSSYYVDRIEHSFENDIHKILINLKAGLFSSYLHYNKSRAYECGNISFEDFYSGEDYNLRNKLKSIRK